MFIGENFTDTIVVYWSEVDNIWVGHSLKTDQIGTGNTPAEARLDAIKAVLQITMAAREDETLAIFRDAPPEIQRLAMQ